VKRKRIFLLSIFLLSLVAFAATPPVNFSGMWTLNRAKSDASPADAPKKSAMKINQQAGRIEIWYYITDGLGDHDWGSNYTLDGKVNHNSWDGVEVKTSQGWDGSTLVFNVRRGANSEYKERWSLSPDGKTLTIKRHTIFSHSSLTEKFVFDKQ